MAEIFRERRIGRTLYAFGKSRVRSGGWVVSYRIQRSQQNRGPLGAEYRGIPKLADLER